MTALLRAELRKLRSTRSLLAVLAFGVVVAGAGSAVLLAVGEPADIADRLSDHGPLRFGPTNFGLLLVVFGVRLFTDETHHQTLGSTLVRTPRRGRVLVAKATVAAATAVAFCLVVDVVVLVVTTVGLAARDLQMTYDVAATAALIGRTTLAMSLLAVLGVVVGAACRNRTVALVAVLVWFALAEDVVGALLHVERFVPGAAVQGLVTASASSATSPQVATATLLTTVAAASIVAAFTLRRDIA